MLVTTPLTALGQALAVPPPSKFIPPVAAAPTVYADEVDAADELKEELGEDDEADRKQPLQWAGDFTLTFEELKDITLDDVARDDRRTAEQELLLGVSYRYSDRLSAFADITLFAEQEDPAGAESRQSVRSIDRGESWLQIESLLGTADSLKVGRQFFYEPRSWWWDAELDAVRLAYAREPWEAYVAIAEQLAVVSTADDFIDPENDAVQRLLGMVSWSRSESLEIVAFYLLQRDRSSNPAPGSVLATEREDDSDADLHWLGLRAIGNVEFESGALAYWLDTGIVTGDETVFEFEETDSTSSTVIGREQQRVRGWAVDIGVDWTLPVALQPTLRLNYAWGSGDDDLDDDTDRAFRQTGLQDPDEQDRRYGELLRPELSNLAITTVALRLALLTDSAVTLGYHRFRQLHPVGSLRDTRLETDPTGERKYIGSEISLVLALQEWEDLEIEFAAASFKAGDAFGSAQGRRAHSLFLQFTYGF